MSYPLTTREQRADAWRVMLAYTKTLPSLLSYQARTQAMLKMSRLERGD